MSELRRNHYGPKADDLCMVCFYSERRGRAPKGILAIASATIASEKSDDTAEVAGRLQSRFWQAFDP